MKFSLSLLASLAMAVVSQAVTITVALEPGGTAVLGGSGRAIFDLSGNPVIGGYVGVGVFTSPIDPLVDPPAVIAAAFNQFGNAGSTSGTDVGGGFVAEGTFSFATSETITAADPLAVQNIWIVVGNAPTLALSTEMLIIDSGQVFGSDEPVPSFATIDLQTFNGTPLYGSSEFAGGEFDFPGFGTFAAAPNSFQLAGIPEPSSSLLFGFAGLALLIRRKR